MICATVKFIATHFNDCQSISVRYNVGSLRLKLHGEKFSSVCQISLINSSHALCATVKEKKAETASLLIHNLFLLKV